MKDADMVPFFHLLNGTNFQFTYVTGTARQYLLTKTIHNAKQIKKYTTTHKTAVCRSSESTSTRASDPEGASITFLYKTCKNQYLQVFIQLYKTWAVWLNQKQLSNWNCNFTNKHQPRLKISQTNQLCHSLPLLTAYLHRCQVPPLHSTAWFLHHHWPTVLTQNQRSVNKVPTSDLKNTQYLSFWFWWSSC